MNATMRLLWVIVASLLLLSGLVVIASKVLSARGLTERFVERPDLPSCVFRESYTSGAFDEVLSPFTINDFKEVETNDKFCGYVVKKHIHPFNYPCVYEDIVRTNSDAVSTETRVGPICSAFIDGFVELDPQSFRITVRVSRRNTEWQNLRVNIYMMDVLQEEDIPVSMESTTNTHFVYFYEPKYAQSHEARVLLKHPMDDAWNEDTDDPTKRRSFFVDLETVTKYRKCRSQRTISGTTNSCGEEFDERSTMYKVLDKVRSLEDFVRVKDVDNTRKGTKLMEVTTQPDDQIYPCVYENIIYREPGPLKPVKYYTPPPCDPVSCEGTEVLVVPCIGTCGLSREKYKMVHTANTDPENDPTMDHCLQYKYNWVSTPQGQFREAPCLSKELCDEKDRCDPEAFYFDPRTGRIVDIKDELHKHKGSLSERIESIMDGQQLNCEDEITVTYRIHPGRCLSENGIVVVHKFYEHVQKYRRKQCA